MFFVHVFEDFFIVFPLPFCFCLFLLGENIFVLSAEKDWPALSYIIWRCRPICQICCNAKLTMCVFWGRVTSECVCKSGKRSWDGVDVANKIRRVLGSSYYALLVHVISFHSPPSAVHLVLVVRNAYCLGADIGLVQLRWSKDDVSVDTNNVTLHVSLRNVYIATLFANC